MSDDNIFTMVPGGKQPPETEEPKLPHNEYCIVTTDGDEFVGTGFLIFTTHHIAIMQDDGKGAIPIILLPLASLKVAGLSEIVEYNGSGEELPF